MSRLTARHWVFDMDGTLTRAIHDFDLMRRTMSVPAGIDILDYLNALPRDEAERHFQWLRQYEYELAEQAQPAEGIHDLLSQLLDQGVTLGLLTRNMAPLARLTLERAGLSDFFPDETLLGRDDAEPKPDPDGLNRLASQWQVAPSSLVMVGDSIIDVMTGRAAGAYTVLMHSDDEEAQALADLSVTTADALIARLGSRA
ncbi:HAD family hydrolase [Zymobacter sp. IVIA_12111.31 C1]|uniref:HAD family hydrolase n=1 Tax=Zymobacter sp. IVIA_12111.31 C1 TaxID=3394854 RepID=UPI0039C2A968